MKKIPFIIALTLTFTTMGQGLVSPNQAMVKGAVEQSVVVVCSGYKLQDTTGQRFGRNNRAEYSQTYTLGVATEEGLVLAPQVTKPWTTDADFVRYRNSHTPVLSSIAYRRLNDSVLTALPLSVDSTTLPPLRLILADTIATVAPLAVHTDGAASGGWLLWVYASDTLGQAGKTATTAVITNAAVGDTTPQYVTAPALSALLRDSIAKPKVLGAVWVTPCYPEAGIVQFKVVGMAVRDDNTWRLTPLHHIAQRNTTSCDELTPSPERDSRINNKKNRNRR